MLTFHYDPVQFAEEMRIKTAELARALHAKIQEFHETGCQSPAVAEECLKLAYKVAQFADSKDVVETCIKIMDPFRFVDGVDYDFWAHVYCDVIRVKHDMLDRAQKNNSADTNEYALQAWLENHWSEYFGPNLRMVKREHKIGPGRVDFLAEDDKGPVLIECKVGIINLRALNQLQNYMYNHGVSRGILVGESCEVLLPEGVQFMPHKFLYLQRSEASSSDGRLLQ